MGSVVPKVRGSILSGCILLGMESHAAAVRVCRNSASKGLAPMVSELRPQPGCRTKELFFMGSKGNGKHFVGLHFAWHGLESCCCSSVSKMFRQKHLWQRFWPVFDAGGSIAFGAFRGQRCGISFHDFRQFLMLDTLAVSAFRRRCFGSFLVAVAWFGHESCWFHNSL